MSLCMHVMCNIYLNCVSFLERKKRKGIDDYNVLRSALSEAQETPSLCYIFIQASHPLQLRDILAVTL